MKTATLALASVLTLSSTFALAQNGGIRSTDSGGTAVMGTGTIQDDNKPPTNWSQDTQPRLGGRSGFTYVPPEITTNPSQQVQPRVH